MRLKCSTRKFLKELVHFQVNHTTSILTQVFHQNSCHVHQQDEFKKQLSKMLDAGVITEVHEATPWINSLSLLKQGKMEKKKLRICLDPMLLNKALMHEPYITYTPDDVYHKLANAKYITVIDFKKSFWQFVLDEKSSYLTTFNTPFGCYHYLRMPFSTNVSGDCHQ